MMSLLAFIPSAIAARFAEAPNKDDEIAELKGEIAELQGEIAELRKSNMELLQTLADERALRLQMSLDMSEAISRWMPPQPAPQAPRRVRNCAPGRHELLVRIPPNGQADLGAMIYGRE